MAQRDAPQVGFDSGEDTSQPQAMSSIKWCLPQIPAAGHAATGGLGSAATEEVLVGEGGVAAGDPGQHPASAQNALKANLIIVVRIGP